MTQRLDLNHEKLDLIHAKRDLTNIKLDLAHAMLDLAHAELDLALEIIKRNPHKVKLDQCKVRCPSKMANNMLNLKIDPNLMVFSLHCKSLSGTVDSWSHFVISDTGCHPRSHNIFRFKINPNLMVFDLLHVPICNSITMIVIFV